MTGPHRGGGRVHVVGAGLAGLAAAVRLAEAGRPIVLYEAGPQAGGRCRSYLDAELGVRIDNGNHLLLSGNSAAVEYVRRIGAGDTFHPAGEPAIPFVDLADGARWSVRPTRGRLPLWLLDPARRIPGTRARDYLAAIRLWRGGLRGTVAEALPPGSVLYRRLWQPLTVAALNAAAEQASARLLWRVLAETLGRGAAACRPLLPRDGLSESLVDPALAFLARHGAEIRFGIRLRALDFAGERVAGLALEAGTVPLAAEDTVILAVPPTVAARLVPGLIVPDDFAPIVNAHFRRAAPAGAPAFVGIVGGTAEWVFVKREVISVTVSAADRLVDRPATELAASLWHDVARTLRIPADPLPPARIVKERRATFRATPVQVARRPPSATRWNNLHLAGDYVDTGLPGTIEGAIRSGFAAAARLGRRGPAAATNPMPEPVSRSATPIEDRQRALP
ncbi:MAG TPA: hydroxysqualene dehydroxylase HpnE [Stellaceae bacterium]|nr:hydroxysqualene dehydroxylase HpnE [Stellaceae bacterium]